MSGNQTPRICLIPEHDDALGQRALEWCAANAITLDPWQELILRAGLSTRPDGKFAAFEVAMCMSRQNGKGEVLLARELFGALELGERLIIHSAHEFATSSEHFRRMEDRIEEAGLEKALRPKAGVKRSHGEEGFEFRNGARIRFRTRTKGGGRGFTGDLVVLDEAQELAEFFHGNLVPIVSARSVTGNPQVWYAANAVDQLIHDNGVVMARMRERALSDEGNLAYFEWSLDYSTPDEVPDRVLADAAAWTQTNPATGIRISLEHIAKEHRALGRRQFAVERCGVGDWPRTDGLGEVVIRLEQWEKLTDEHSRALDPVVFAFDVKPDRSRSCIAVAGFRRDDLFHVEVVDARVGTGWLVGRLRELDERHRPLVVICDGVGPAVSLLPELEQMGVRVRTLTSSEYAQGCGMFFDAVEQEKLRHLGTNDLQAAIRGAVKRPLGDLWAWSRGNSQTDITPLVASTLAFWGASVLGRVSVPLVATV